MSEWIEFVVTFIIPPPLPLRRLQVHISPPPHHPWPRAAPQTHTHTHTSTLTRDSSSSWGDTAQLGTFRAM